VREATRAVLDAHDRGQGDDGLLGALVSHFGVDGAAGLARAVNDEPTPANWGPAAVAVFQAADRGSALAGRVVDDAGTALAGLVGRLVERGAVGDVVVAAGSVIVRQERLRARLAQELGTDMALRVLDVDPVVGAVVLARRLVRA
jgi:N-acetylglucosamine kinase-like BadF-type ATPase